MGQMTEMSQRKKQVNVNMGYWSMFVLPQ